MEKLYLNMMCYSLFCKNAFLCHIGPLGLCGRGKHHPIHYECATESRSGSSLSCPQQPCWSRRALCTQVQQPVCCWKLLGSCKSCCKCTKGRPLVNMEPVERWRKIWPLWYMGIFQTLHLLVQTCFAIHHALSFCHLCHFRVSCEPQTPFAVFRVFQLNLARPPHCCSTLASCWTRASWTNLSPLSYAGLFSNKDGSSFLRSG